MHPQPRMQLVE